jgi:hypothetical protein
MRGLLGRIWRSHRVATVVFALLLLVGSWLFWTQPPLGARHRLWTGPRVSSDGWYYYHALRSLILDGDLDYSNEYKQFGNWYGYGESSIGRPRNPFGIGPALLWAPGFIVGHLIATARDSTEPHRQGNGYSPAEQGAALYLSFLAGWAAVLLGYLFARRFVPAMPALLGALAAGFGGPLLFYTLYEPAVPHALDAFAAALFVFWGLPFGRGRSWRWWIIYGLVAGLCVLVRPQHAVFLGLPAAHLLWEAHRDLPRGRRSAIQRLLLRGAAFSLGLLVVTSPQMLAWKAVYGSWITIPQGPDFMRWAAPMWSEVLFSSRNGLMSTSPAMWLTLVGFPLLIRRHPRVGLFAALLFASQVWVNGAAWDWWAGGAYGGRRFSGLPYLAAYKAKTFRWNTTQPHSERLAATWRLQRIGRQPAFASPLSFPANLVFAWRYDRSMVQYERLVGRYLLDECIGPNAIRRTKKTERVDMRHRSAAAFAGRNTRWTRQGLAIAPGRAEILVPLNRPGGLEVKLHLATPPASDLAMDWQGMPLRLQIGGRNSRIASATIPKTAVGRGIHVLTVRSSRAVVLAALQLKEGRDWPAPWARRLP